MGDMADYYLETSFLDTFLMFTDPIAAYEAGIIDELGYEIQSGPQPKTCRCCGTGNLYWGQVGNKWLLFDEEGMHNCPVNPYEKWPVRLDA